LAILLAASFLIATGTRGENAFGLRSDNPASRKCSAVIARKEVMAAHDTTRIAA